MRSFFPSQISFVLLLLLFATTFRRSICSSSKKVGCNERDESILLMFKEGVVNSSYTVLSSWSREEDCCSWDGVHCDNITRRVTELDLNYQGLQGVIDLSLLQLQFLAYLNLSGNSFTSVCTNPPCQVSNKLPLHTDKSNNHFSAPLFLHYLDFSWNYMALHDLHWLSPLSSLKYLDLSGNDIGSEPKWLHYVAMLPSLSELHLANCSLRDFPSHVHINFSAPLFLHYLDLKSNYMALNDLQWLSQLSSLKYLDLSGNDIGSEPKWLHYVAMLPSLSELHLASCSLRDFPSYNYVSLTSLQTLDLSDNNITSELPHSFFHVTKAISSIDLSGNSFYGGLPVALFELPNLNYLSLHNNKLEGPIPSSVGNLSLLASLDVPYNYLSGILPETLGQLQKLSDLKVVGNFWKGALSEKNFANLSSLTSLELSSTGFKFNFDPDWIPPFQLSIFMSANTSIGANFPVWLYTQKSLEQLDISNSGVSTIDDADTFWSFISRINGIVDLSNNLMSGDISNVTLRSISATLDYNNFTRGLPQISSSVTLFFASHNSFSGSISQFLCHSQSDWRNLVVLDLSYNHLIGVLPDCWPKWKYLDYINLQCNQLTGKVPPSMASLNPEILDLRDNNFFGEFSLDLSNWTNLQELLLDGNVFSGSLPNPYMAQNLQVLNLRANQFTGNIPLQFCNLSSLTILDLAENKLSGSIPHCLYNIMQPIEISSAIETLQIFTKGTGLIYRSNVLVDLRSGVVDLSSNCLSGEIPKELYSINRLQSLNLSRNDLIGKIPKEIGSLKNLESLDLSQNRLSGEIPSTISQLSFLAYLNLSYNNFMGQIPTGTQIQSFDTWSFVGNPKLCGDPLPKKCNKKGETHESKLTEGNEDNDFLKSLLLGMGVGFAAGFWAVCGSLFLVRAWRHKFFRCFDHLVDRLYVSWVLCFRRFR